MAAVLKHDCVNNDFPGERMSGHPDGNDQNFGRLFVRCEPRIYGFIRSLVIHPADAEDLLQETASTLWQKFGEFREGTDFLAWALQVARYHVLYFRRRQRRDTLRFSDEFIDAVGADTLTETIRLRDLQGILAKCMDKLPPADCDLFRLRCQSDLPIKELAQELGRPLSSVYNALGRIRRVLAECVERELARENGP
jgi:RNA polymerase sigma-70 factor (ECF subfamily)